MSVWEAAVIVGSLVGLLVAFAIYYSFVREQMFRLARYEYWADRFYSSAKPLVAHPATPPQVISLIESLNELISDRSAPMGLYQVYRKKIEGKREKTTSKSDGKVRNFFKDHPDMVRHANVVSNAGFLAASYSSMVGGSQARAVLADIFAEMELHDHEIGDAQDVRDVQHSPRSTSLVPLIMRK